MTTRKAIKLPLKKETANTIQYQAADADKPTASIPTIYIRKTDLPDPWPAFINIEFYGSDE